MADFTTRVELHSATYADYEILHAAMQYEGFLRLIKADTGVWYHLPTAEYECSGLVTINQVIATAQRAAAKTSRTSSVLVTEAKQRMWSGLPLAY